MRAGGSGYVKEGCDLVDLVAPAGNLLIEVEQDSVCDHGGRIASMLEQDRIVTALAQMRGSWGAPY